MFKEAIKKNLAYTRPLFTGERLFNDTKVNSGISSFIILNEDGYVLTCKHVAEKIVIANELDQKYKNYLKEIDGKTVKELKELEKKYSYNEEELVQVKNIFMNCFENGFLEQIIFHNNYDLAVIKFANFSQVNTDIFPTFTDKNIEPGESVCKLGFPWPTYDCFKFNSKTNEIEIKDDASFQTPAFPIDGMITRLICDESENEFAFETSTPGLKGQSGGPVFDTSGNILGIQSATTSLDLMFDIDANVIRNNKEVHVSEKQFINLGIVMSSKAIMKFLDDNHIKYNKK